MRLLLIFLFPSCLFAQASQIGFSITLGDTVLEPGKNYFFENRSISIENLKFYISDLVLFRKNKIVFEDPKKVRLIDIENINSLTIQLKRCAKFDKIVFYLGIDSLINVSGALGEDLDPTNGMYWTWQSGYINFKLEGKDPLCKSRHQKFQYHLGGYAYPFSTLQQINLKLKNPSESAEIKLAIDDFLKAAKPEIQPEIMSPGLRAVELTKILKQLFKVKS